MSWVNKWIKQFLYISGEASWRESRGLIAPTWKVSVTFFVLVCLLFLTDRYFRTKTENCGQQQPQNSFHGVKVAVGAFSFSLKRLQNGYKHHSRTRINCKSIWRWVLLCLFRNHRSVYFPLHLRGFWSLIYPEKAWRNIALHVGHLS